MGDSLFRQLAKLLSSRAPNAEFARVVGRPKSTIRSWISGQRRPPIEIYELLRDELQRRIEQHHALKEEVKIAMWRRQGEPPPPRHRGFLEIKVREPGGQPRDARWRGGGPRKLSPR
jgi:hypothetical protein